MAGVEYVVLKTSRIANSDRADQSGSDGGDVAGWVKTADFILGIQIDCEKGPIARAYKLQWRDVTAAGSFADVGAATEISYAATTVLVDGAALAEGNKLCTGVPAGSTWQNGMESEGDNELPDDPDTFSLADEYYTEFQWALDCSGAIDAHEYEFQLYDVTQGVAIAGACPSTITMAWIPPVADIDIGAEPIVRDSFADFGITWIDKNNPANASGALHSVKVYAVDDLYGLIVGTFYFVSQNDQTTLKCRDSVAIGDVAAGAVRTFTELSIAVEIGDYIGCYFDPPYGWLYLDDSGYGGVWWIEGEYIDPNDEIAYKFYPGYAISLYGYGDIEAPPGLENKSANMGSKMVAAGLI